MGRARLGAREKRGEKVFYAMYEGGANKIDPNVDAGVSREEE